MADDVKYSYEIVDVTYYIHNGKKKKKVKKKKKRVGGTGSKYISRESSFMRTESVYSIQ